MDNQIISELFLNIMYIIGLIFSYFIIALLKKKLGIENLKKIDHEIQTNQELARLAVLYVQKSFKDVDSQTKYREAFIALSEMLNKKGIALTESEIQILIESSLKTLKKQFGNAWKEQVR